MRKEGFRRRFVVLVVVATLHFLFLLMLLAREPDARKVAHSEPSSVLFFIERPRSLRPTTAPPVQSGTTPATTMTITESNAPERISIAPTPTDPLATIDWTAQAAIAAAAVVDKAIREELRKCDPSNAPSSFLPPCNPRTKQFEWNPEQPRVGFSGGLPYVRIGERCAIGLGFFGCGFGDPPPANGDLFEGMDDPERDRSSVPAPDP